MPQQHPSLIKAFAEVDGFFSRHCRTSHMPQSLQTIAERAHELIDTHTDYSDDDKTAMKIVAVLSLGAPTVLGNARDFELRYGAKARALASQMQGSDASGSLADISMALSIAVIESDIALKNGQKPSRNLTSEGVRIEADRLKDSRAEALASGASQKLFDLEQQRMVDLTAAVDKRQQKRKAQFKAGA